MTFDLAHVRNLPAWVKRWQLARRADDFRLFPEQLPGVRSLHFDHGYPQGDDAKVLGYPSGYEPQILASHSPQDDSESWVQPEEYVA